MTDFTLEIKQPFSEPLSLATRKQESRSSTFAGKNTPSKNIRRFYRATGTYCLSLKDVQIFGVSGRRGAHFGAIRQNGITCARVLNMSS